MEAIESLDVAAFQQYLKQTKNTICGRVPIEILMHVCLSLSLSLSVRLSLCALHLSHPRLACVESRLYTIVPNNIV
jgi:predicted class III extradiol MEMO1 family dioxygenase